MCKSRMDMEIKQTLLGQTVSETMKLKRKWKVHEQKLHTEEMNNWTSLIEQISMHAIVTDYVSL